MSGTPNVTPVRHLVALIWWLLMVAAGLAGRLPSASMCAPRRLPPARSGRWLMASLAVAGAFHSTSGATGIGPSISSALDLQVQVSTPFIYRITINQPWVINSFDAHPLPPGLSFNKKLGVITGKPTQIGTNTLSITASQDNLPDRTLTGTLVLRVTGQVTPPLFSVEPVDTTAVLGKDVVLTSEAIGTGPVSYQWYRYAFVFRGQLLDLGEPIPGATNAAIVLRGITGDDEGYYVSTSTNPGGTSISRPALLEEIRPPSLAFGLGNWMFHEGTSAYLNVGGDGGAELFFQWRKDGRPIPGATNSYLLFQAVAPTDAGSYDVVLSNAAGSIVTAPGSVDVVAPLELHVSPAPDDFTGARSLRFNSIPGATYYLQFAPTFRPEDWRTLKTIVPKGTNADTVLPLGGPVRFFRVTQ